MWPDGAAPGPAGSGPSSSGSEVAVTEQILAAARNPLPANMYISQSLGTHIGPKIITQNIQSNEVVQGRFLGLALVSPRQTRSLRCSVAVFVCWALVVASGLAFYLFHLTLHQQTRLDIGLNETWYVRREEWQAMPAYAVEYRSLPVKYVIITHSATPYCNTKYKCVEKVLLIQQGHLQRGYDDIGPNYLVGGNGLVFEGRGANVIGAVVPSWNTKSITVTFLGDYRTDEVDDLQLEHVNKFLQVLVQDSVLDKNYVLYGHCQVVPYIYSPDLPLPQYLCMVISNTTRAERVACSVAFLLVIVCTILIVYFTVLASAANAVDVAPHEWNITREMWLARTYNESERITPQYEPLRLVIIQHTVSQDCPAFKKCAAELRNLQNYFLDYSHYDIPYNFLIGNDGRVYEGRGWRVMGAHTKGYNRCSLGIGFIGDYRDEKEAHSTVTAAQVNRTQILLNEGVKQGYLDPHYVVVGARDLQATESPGSNLYNAIRKWKHYDSNLYRNMNCEEIMAAPIGTDI